LHRYEIAVIGSGPGGHGAAIQAAKLGKQAVVIERRPAVGGTSVNTGSIPSKTLREAVLCLTGARQRQLYGVHCAISQDFRISDLVGRCDHVVHDEIEVTRHQFARNNVTVMEGQASFAGPHTLRIRHQDGLQEIEAQSIIIACGTMPTHSPKVPCNGRTIVDSDGVFSIPAIPRSMVVVGAGAVGVEYACIFAALGVEVTVVDQRQRILEFVDAEIMEALLYHMRQEGVILRMGEEVTEVTENGRGVVAHTASHKKIVGEVLLYTVGRRGATAELALESVGITPDERGRIPVDSYYRTAVPSIYAVGDVVGFPALASTSMEQGRIAVRHALGDESVPVTSLVPYGLYTIPEISMVGQTEEQLTQASIPYEIGVARYRETARGQIIGDRTGTLKLLVHSETRKLLGVHIIGEGATELVHIGQLAIGLGARVDYLVNSTFNYPTLAEAYRIAALDAYNKLG
jgi:NAD(P) transhydrogenase